MPALSGSRDELSEAMADDSHAESSSDVEESFTFGSFTVEDTKEFKRSYNGLPKQQVSAKKVSGVSTLFSFVCCRCVQQLVSFTVKRSPQLSWCAWW